MRLRALAAAPRRRPALVLAGAAAVLAALGAASPARALQRPGGGASPDSTPYFRAVVVARPVRDSMNAAFLDGNRHWNELQDVNTLTQMIGTAVPTQKEFLGCLRGRVERDTLWVTGTVAARGMRRFQFAVTGSCDGVRDLVGTWHTHPFRADLENRPLKERSLSRDDIGTFAAGRDLVIFALWDADSLDAAARRADGAVRHPSPVVLH